MEYQKMVLIPIEQYNHWKNLVATTPNVDVLSNDHNEMLSAKSQASDIPLQEKKRGGVKINKSGKKAIVNKKSQKILTGVKHVIKKKIPAINNKKKKTSLKSEYIKKTLPLGGNSVAASFWSDEWIKL
jgi:hypothetical protein